MTKAELVELKGRILWQNHYTTSRGNYTLTAVEYCGDIWLVKHKDCQRVECINLSESERRKR